MVGDPEEKRTPGKRRLKDNIKMDLRELGGKGED
jgi:hypothetical protein